MVDIGVAVRVRESDEGKVVIRDVKNKLAPNMMRKITEKDWLTKQWNEYRGWKV